jgi:hypothetical protein
MSAKTGADSLPAWPAAFGTDRGLAKKELGPFRQKKMGYDAHPAFLAAPRRPLRAAVASDGRILYVFRFARNLRIASEARWRGLGGVSRRL